MEILKDLAAPATVRRDRFIIIRRDERRSSGVLRFGLGKSWRGIALLIMLSFSVTALVLGRTHAQSANEYQVKAAFLYNFAKFVEWPSEAFSYSSAPLVVGVMGDDPFGSTLDQAIAGKVVNGHPLMIKRLKWGQDLRGCHILFISSSERKRLGQIFDSLRGANVLTIGESDRFGQEGGIITFVMEEEKVRFEINTSVADQSRLRVSSKLLALAKGARNGQQAGRN
jgi:hypothetical protein